MIKFLAKLFASIIFIVIALNVWGHFKPAPLIPTIVGFACLSAIVIIWKMGPKPIVRDPIPRKKRIRQLSTTQSGGNQANAENVKVFDDNAFDLWLSKNSFDRASLPPKALAQLRDAFIEDQSKS
jgi:hypothetical protein